MLPLTLKHSCVWTHHLIDRNMRFVWFQTSINMQWPNTWISMFTSNQKKKKSVRWWDGIEDNFWFLPVHFVFTPCAWRAGWTAQNIHIWRDTEILDCAYVTHWISSFAYMSVCLLCACQSGAVYTSVSLCLRVGLSPQARPVDLY